MNIYITCLLVFISQILAVGIKTKAVVDVINDNKLSIFVTNLLANLFRLVSLALGVESIINFEKEIDVNNIVIIIVYLIASGLGGLLGAINYNGSNNKKEP